MTNSKAFNFTLVVLGIAAVSLALIWAVRVHGAEFPKQTVSPRAHATSTVYALTWGASQRVLATSTYENATPLIPATAGRASVTFQAINCGTTGQVWLQFNDVAAGTSTGYSLTGSTTVTLADTLPMFNGSIRALASSANCSLTVIENRYE